ncbi:MAG: hypothetical protein U0166_23480 [Acidobacteriota bacterium]
MNGTAVATLALGAGLVVLALAFSYRAWRDPVAPGDRGRRPRRLVGAALLGVLGAGLVFWERMEPSKDPVAFLNVSAVLLAIVGVLVVLAMVDFSAVNAAEKHRKLSLMTQELYGVPLKEIDEKDAEKVGREAVEGLLALRKKARADRGGGKEDTRGNPV